MRVLIAFDRPRVASHLAAQLRVLGHEVAGTVTGERAAVEAARRLEPDLVILGLRLPALDGIQAARAILAGRLVPIILCAHYATADAVRRARRTGIMAWLSPRADARELGRMIALAQARAAELRVLTEETGELAQALRARVVVESAKRALMRRLGLTEAEAFGHLHRHSRSLGATLVQTAGQCLDAEDLLFGRPRLAHCLRTLLPALWTARRAGVPSPAVR